MDGLTDAELVLLGLVAERPRHGYELEAVIAERNVREWTVLGFSSIYYVLNKLESRGLVTSVRPDRNQKSRRTYSLRPEGMAACVEGTRVALEQVSPMHSPVLIGLANSPVLPPGGLTEALRRRRAAVAARIASMQAARAAQEPLDGFVGAIFEHGIAMLQADLGWIGGQLDADG